MSHTNNIKFKTNYLFTRPNFCNGIGSVFGIWGNYFTFKRFSSGMKSDKEAIKNDVGVIGYDFRVALDGLEISRKKMDLLHAKLEAIEQRRKVLLMKESAINSFLEASKRLETNSEKTNKKRTWETTKG